MLFFFTNADAETVQLFGDGDAAFLIDGSWKVNYFVENYPDQLGDYAVSYVPAKANGAITGVVGAVQDTISSECKTDLFGNVQNVVTGAMTAEDAVSSAIALN